MLFARYGDLIPSAAIAFKRQLCLYTDFKFTGLGLTGIEDPLSSLKQLSRILLLPMLAFRRDSRQSLGRHINRPFFYLASHVCLFRSHPQLLHTFSHKSGDVNQEFHSHFPVPLSTTSYWRAVKDKAELQEETKPRVLNGITK
jgi:hypothetical protein